MWIDGELLIPLDGSSLAENALPLAATVVGALDRPVRLLHIVSDYEGELTSTDVDRARELFREYGEKALRDCGISLDRARIDVDHGSPATRILAAAEHAAAIVIATHGRGGFRANIIGSVADKVIRGAQVPIFVAPGTAYKAVGPSQERPVLVALDGSEAAETALQYARDFAKGINAKVVLLQAYHVPPTVGIEFAYYPADYAYTLETAAREYLAEIVQPGEESFVVYAEAANAIVEVAHRLDAGLVVMASSGKGLARRLALGSVTDRVVHSIHRPLLIIPAGAEA
ncbi:MAG: universal stress protein [Dehalococcoidia bacterium]|nr:universal stress protein [Dehalococcoidia bacterium]